MQEGRIDIETDVQSANMTGIINPVQSISGKINPVIMMSGTLNVAEGYYPDIYEGTLEFTSAVSIDQEIPTKKKLITNDITIKKIPYFETSNLSGTTVYIGE